MKKTVLSLIFCIASVCATQSVEATQSHKQYVMAREIAFRDGYFRLKRQGNPVLKLKNLRANNSGIYYLPRDVFVGGEKEKRHGGCANRPAHSEHHYRNPGRKPNGVPGGHHDGWDPGANGPAGR